MAKAKTYSFMCMPADTMAPPRTPGMTHERDYSLELNRPRVRTRESYAAEENTSSEQINDTGLVHRQPL